MLRQGQLKPPRKRWLLRSGTWTTSGAGSPGALAAPGSRSLSTATRGSPHGATAPGQRQLRGFAPEAVGRAMELAAQVEPGQAAIRGTRTGSARSEWRGVAYAFEGGGDIAVAEWSALDGGGGS